MGQKKAALTVVLKADPTVEKTVVLKAVSRVVLMAVSRVAQDVGYDDDGVLRPGGCTVDAEFDILINIYVIIIVPRIIKWAYRFNVRSVGMKREEYIYHK